MTCATASGRLRIDGHLGAEAASERKLLLGHVDGRHVETHRLGVLAGDVAKPADPRDGDPLAGLRFGFLNALICRYSGAQDRRDLGEVRVAR
jgi:hypothetical protein